METVLPSIPNTNETKPITQPVVEPVAPVTPPVTPEPIKVEPVAPTPTVTPEAPKVEPVKPATPVTPVQTPELSDVEKNAQSTGVKYTMVD